MGTNLTKNNVIATNATWIEGAAIEQLNFTASLPGMTRVCGMPDLHPGRGYPVGASFFSTNIIYPALVGNDIGCGMAFYQTDLPRHKWSGVKLAEKLGNIDGPLDEIQDCDLDSLAPSVLPHIRSLGTIGGGNHFAEVQQFDEIFITKEDLSKHYPQLNPKSLLLLVHSGSRGLGEAILRQHIDKFGHKGINLQDPAFDAYFKEHNAALSFASLNRVLIAKRMLLKWKANGTQLLDVHHNFVEPLSLAEGQGYVHRKGATPSNRGLVVIPGSRGDYSYLVEPVASEESLYSLAHGAGRKWMRSDCYGKLGNKLGLKDLINNGMSSTVVCNDKALMFEEAPQAYKKIDSIIEALESFGLIKKIAKFSPVMTYKTKGGCSC